MKERDLIIFTLIGMTFMVPFLITCLINPDGFSKHESWSLIILGMGTVSLPITIFGFFRLINLESGIQNNGVV